MGDIPALIFVLFFRTYAQNAQGKKQSQRKEQEMTAYSFNGDKRFRGIEPFADRLWLASPTMHGEELTYIK